MKAETPVLSPPHKERSRIDAGPEAGWRWASLGVLWLAFLYLWILPLFVPRGIYFWGHYKSRDVLLGIPVGLVTLWATLVALSPAPLRRRVGLRLGTVLLSAVFGVGLFEVAYTFGYRMVWRDRSWYEYCGANFVYNRRDPELGYIRKPFLSWRSNVDPGMGAPRAHFPPIFYRTDENGFRNAPGLRHADVVFIGDSFTEAAALPEDRTYVQQVGARTGLSVVNLGIGGYGPQQELAVLRRYGVRYHPHYVVWELYEGNDLMDAEVFTLWKQHRYRGSGSLWERYTSASPVVTLLGRTIPGQSPGQTPAPEGSFASTLHLTGGGTARLLGYARYHYDEPERYPLGLSETRQAISAAAQLCQSIGAKLLIFQIPPRERVLAPYITFDSPRDREKALPAGITDNPHDMAHCLAAFCRRLPCTFVDAFPALRASAARNDRDLYLWGDKHLDVGGNTVVAQLIVQWLRSQKPWPPQGR